MCVPDTWAMLVLGERFGSDGGHEVVPLGWTAQPVRTDPQGTAYAGATRTGADVAERKGLLWAGLWRLTQNRVVPTVFCVASRTTAGQAMGSLGVTDPKLHFDCSEPYSKPCNMAYPRNTFKYIMFVPTLEIPMQ